MDHYPEPTETVQTAQPVQPLADETRPNTLQVNFSWKKFKTLISDNDKPLYVMESRVFKLPTLVFRSAVDDSQIGSGTMHAISINPDFECDGHKGTLLARTRIQPVYGYSSRLYSSDRSPMTMTWTSGSFFKSFDYILLDDKSLPIAKFTSRIVAVKNIAKIEFLDPRCNNDAVRREIIITGLTLYFCMVYRTNNILNIVGMIFYRPSKAKERYAEIDPAAKAQAHADADAMAQQEQLAKGTGTNGAVPGQHDKL